MQLTQQHHDSLTEVLNIAFGRAAASLATLAGQRVLMTVPHVELYPTHALGDALRTFLTGDLAIVQQIFTGSLGGHALLFFSDDGARQLTLQVEHGYRAGDAPTSADEDSLTEIGHIVLNATLGVFAELLEAHLSFSTPRFHGKDLATMLQTVLEPNIRLQYALIILTGFQIAHLEITGYLVLILSVPSMERLLQAIARYMEE